MKHVPLTDDTAKDIIKELKQAYAGKSTTCGTGVVMDPYQAKWQVMREACYRYHAGYINGEGGYGGSVNHPDHYGILFQGWSPRIMSCAQGVEHENVSLYLDALLDPDGPFKAMLPHLYHTTTKEVLEDKGFVIKDASKGNGGLIWTFLQASRLMYEQPGYMARFLHARKYGNPMALLITMSLSPTNANFNADWAVGVTGHCAPLGAQNGWAIYENFLSGRIVKDYQHCTSGSWQCYGQANTPPNFYRTASQYNKTLDAWVECFNGGKNAGGKIAKAA